MCEYEHKQYSVCAINVAKGYHSRHIHLADMSEAIASQSLRESKTSTSPSSLLIIVMFKENEAWANEMQPRFCHN